jgi:hypothetical protein
MTLIKEAETGRAALHDKWQSGHTCIAVMPQNSHQVDDRGDHCITGELCSTISIGKGSLTASI